MMESNYPYSDGRQNRKMTAEEREKLRQQKIALVDRFLVMNQNDLPDDKIPMLRENMLHC